MISAEIMTSGSWDWAPVLTLFSIYEGVCLRFSQPLPLPHPPSNLKIQKQKQDEWETPKDPENRILTPEKGKGKDSWAADLKNIQPWLDRSLRTPGEILLKKILKERLMSLTMWRDVQENLTRVILKRQMLTTHTYAQTKKSCNKKGTLIKHYVPLRWIMFHNYYHNNVNTEYWFNQMVIY